MVIYGLAWIIKDFNPQVIDSKKPREEKIDSPLITNINSPPGPRQLRSIFRKFIRNSSANNSHQWIILSSVKNSLKFRKIFFYQEGGCRIHSFIFNAFFNASHSIFKRSFNFDALSVNLRRLPLIYLVKKHYSVPSSNSEEKCGGKKIL